MCICLNNFILLHNPSFYSSTQLSLFYISRVSYSNTILASLDSNVPTAMKTAWTVDLCCSNHSASPSIQQYTVIVYQLPPVNSVLCSRSSCWALRVQGSAIKNQLVSTYGGAIIVKKTWFLVKYNSTMGCKLPKCAFFHSSQRPSNSAFIFKPMLMLYGRQNCLHKTRKTSEKRWKLVSAFN